MATQGKITKTITTRQQRAIAALLVERDIKKAAESAGVGYRSLCRWLDDRQFQSELKSAEGAVIALDQTFLKWRDTICLEQRISELEKAVFHE